MLNDMLLGQYVNRDSVIHHIWAGTKLIAVFALAIALVLLRWTPGYLICFAVLALTVWLARLPVGYLWRSSRFFIIILFIGMLPTLFFAEGDDPTRVVFGIWTVEGVRRSIRIFSMLGLIFLDAKVLMMTTRTVDVIDALAVLLGPLRRIRLPVDEMVMTTALALRFIPLMADEMTKLVRAQQARGGLARRDFRGQAQMLLGLVMPLLNNNLERSEELATAMEARGYAGGPWVNPSPLRLRPLDIIVIVAIVALSLALSITRWTATPWP